MVKTRNSSKNASNLEDKELPSTPDNCINESRDGSITSEFIYEHESQSSEDSNAEYLLNSSTNSVDSQVSEYLDEIDEAGFGSPLKDDVALEYNNLPVPTSNNNFGMVLGIIVASLLVLYYVATLLKSNNDSDTMQFSGYDNIEARLKIFENNFKKVHAKFKEQSPHSWKTVKATMKSVLKTINPTRPAVLMLIGSPSVKNCEMLLNCLSKDIGSAVPKSYSTNSEIYISKSDFSGLDDDQAKLAVDSKLQKAFDAGTKIVIVDDITSYPAGVLLLFHSYCDNENAPYKDVVFIMHVSPKTVLAKSEIEDFLSDVWSKTLNDIDEAGALLSRLANNIIHVNEEPAIRHC